MDENEWYVIEISQIPGINDSERIEKAIEKARASLQEKVIINLEHKTTYKISRAITIDNMKNCEINGNGSLLLNCTFDSQRIIPYDCTFIIKNSENITIKNLSVDYMPLPFMQGVIKSIDELSLNVEVVVDKGYMMPKELIALIKSGFFMVMDRQSKSLKLGARNFNVPRKVAYIDEDTIKVTLDWELNTDDPGQTPAQIGDVVLIRPHFEVAVSIENCSNTTFDDFHLWSSPAFGLIENGGFGGTKIINSSIEPGPKPPNAEYDRLSSTNSDGTHFIGVVKGPHIENVVYSNTADDPINIHNFYFFVVKKIDQKHYLLTPKWDVGLKSGDIVKFSDKDTFEVMGSGRLVSLEKKQDPQLAGIIADVWKGKSPTSMPDTVYEVELENEFDLEAGDAVISVTRSASGTVIKNCSFHGCGRVMVKCPDAVIENNHFEYSGYVAIHAGSDVGFWAESDFADKLLIKNNTFQNCMVGAINFFPISDALGTIFVGVTLPLDKKGFAKNYENKNIVIEGNSFEDSNLCAIFAVNCDGIKIQNNRLGNCFSRNAKFGAGEKYDIDLKSAIFVGHTKNASIIGNQAKLGDICKEVVIVDSSCDMKTFMIDNNVLVKF